MKKWVRRHPYLALAFGYVLVFVLAVAAWRVFDASDPATVIFRTFMNTLVYWLFALVPEAIRGPFEDLLGIHSPSRVFMGYGVNIGQGLINGIDGMHGKIESAVTGMASVPPAPTFGASSYSAGMSPASAPSISGRMTLMVGGREFDAYLSESTDSRINAADNRSTCAEAALRARPGPRPACDLQGAKQTE
jgi:hypothetical protein